MAMRLVEGLKFLRLPIRLFDAFARLRVPFDEPVLSPFAQGLGLRRIGCTAFRERQLCAGSRPKADRRLSSPTQTFPKLDRFRQIGHSANARLRTSWFQSNVVQWVDFGLAWQR